LEGWEPTVETAHAHDDADGGRTLDRARGMERRPRDERERQEPGDARKEREETIAREKGRKLSERERKRERKRDRRSAADEPTRTARLP
jgi:hypothetical protein